MSIFPPGNFVESANSLPPVNIHVENSLSKFEWENVLSPGNFDPTNVDAEDFQLLREESDLQFGPSLTSEEVDRAIRDRIPEKTRRSTQWAVNIFLTWCQVRGVKFIMEACRQDSSPYPPNTLVGLAAGIQHHLRENSRPELAILKENDPMFART